MADTFQSGYIKVDEKGIHISMYYFPFGTKLVRYENIGHIETYPASGNSKAWGMTPLIFRWTWWSLECGRNFSSMQVVEIVPKGGVGFFSPRIGITVPEHEELIKVIKANAAKKGITVEVREANL
jgi:hypothetical protein